MDCNYWSCYVQEDERLLIGGLSPLMFETIRNIAQSENYSQFIKSLNILGIMITGSAMQEMEPSSGDVESIKAMMNGEIGVGDESDNLIPKYIQTFFHHFLMKKTEIAINFYDWNIHLYPSSKLQPVVRYGYKKFNKLFGYSKSEMSFDFALFVKLFPNLKVFTIGNFVVGKAFPSIKLSYDFVIKMFECIEYLNASSKSLAFSRFQIIKPGSSINEFIQSMMNQFELNGWKLKSDIFVDEGLHAHLGSPEMLVIEKVNK